MSPETSEGTFRDRIKILLAVKACVFSADQVSLTGWKQNGSSDQLERIKLTHGQLQETNVVPSPYTVLKRIDEYPETTAALDSPIECRRDSFLDGLVDRYA